MAYTKINWQNSPSTNTPVSETNLKHMDDGIENNDKRLNGSIPMGNVVVDSIRSKNMFSGFLLGAYNSSTGVFDPTNPATYATNKLSVKSGQKYCISGFATNTAVRFLYWNNNTFTATEVLTTTSSPTVITAQGNYMAFQTSSSSSFSNLQVEEGETATTYTPYQQLDITNTIPITITSSYTIDGNYSYRLGSIIHLEINIYNNNGTYTTGTWIPIATLPSNIKPTNERTANGFGCSSGWTSPTSIPVLVKTDGTVNIYVQTSLKRAVISFEYNV